jgi:hypothetical protein
MAISEDTAWTLACALKGGTYLISLDAFLRGYYLIALPEIHTSHAIGPIFQRNEPHIEPGSWQPIRRAGHLY